MANFNKVILAGNLTRDPQLSYLPSGSAACEFGMAINRKWRSQEGEMRDETCFVDLRCYGKQAETLNQYMSKGRGLLVEGRLKLDQWEAKDGGKRSKLYVVVDSFQFLGGPQGGGPSGGSRPAPSGRAVSGAGGYAGGHPTAPSPDTDEMPPMADGGEEPPF